MLVLILIQFGVSFPIKIDISFVENDSSRHLLFQTILNIARPMLTLIEPVGTYLRPDIHTFEWSKLSAPPQPLSQHFAHLLSIFQNYAMGGVKLRYGGGFTL